MVDIDPSYFADDPAEQESPPAGRQIRLTRASDIPPRPVWWTWTDRLPLGEVCLTPGRGGVGKSTFHAWLMAKLTRGALPGVHYSRPRPVIIAATEDSWERTIVPRLLVAGADLDLVYRADVVVEDAAGLSLTLPHDCKQLETEITRLGAVLLSLDPLMSVISGTIDTHKDREVRRALEPLGQLADRTDCTVLGNAHFRKARDDDPMLMAMGSAAFGNVVRAALGFARDTDDLGKPLEDGSCVISQIKNNLGLLDLPSLRYRIESETLRTDEGIATVGKLVMLGESDRSVLDIFSVGTGQDTDDRDELEQVIKWLRDYLTAAVKAKSGDVKKAARDAGFAERTLHRARQKLRVETPGEGFPRITWWRLPDDPRTGPPDGGNGDDDQPRAATERDDHSCANPDGTTEDGTTDTTGADLRKQAPDQASRATPYEWHNRPPPPASNGHGEYAAERQPAVPCRICGQRLMLAQPGRDTCEACRRAVEEASS